MHNKEIMHLYNLCKVISHPKYTGMFAIGKLQSYIQIHTENLLLLTDVLDNTVPEFSFV